MTSRQLAAASRSTAAQSKVEQALELTTALQRIFDLHKETFAEAARPDPPLPPMVDAEGIRRAYVVDAKRRTSVFALQKRKAAISEARAFAEAEVNRLSVEYAEQRKRWEADLDESWAALHANDPDTVLATLAAAFEDNKAAAAAVGIEGDEVSLAVIVPPVDYIPERTPSRTAAGNLSLKKITKRETAELYKLVVAGFVLVTVKEAFAAAPGIKSACVVAVRCGDDRRTLEPVLGATISRSALRRGPWESQDAWTVLHACADECVIREKGVTKALQPLDVGQHPELNSLLQAIAFDDFADAQAKDGKS
jgi:hypothetical protein